jgi:hypothetical protein
MFNLEAVPDSFHDVNKRNVIVVEDLLRYLAPLWPNRLCRVAHEPFKSWSIVFKNSECAVANDPGAA